MSSHFGTIDCVNVDTWAGMKLIIDAVGAGTVFFCKHPSHLSIVVEHGSIPFQFIMKVKNPISADQTNFEANYEPAALCVGEEA